MRNRFAVALATFVSCLIHVAAPGKVWLVQLNVQLTFSKNDGSQKQEAVKDGDCPEKCGHDLLKIYPCVTLSSEV